MNPYPHNSKERDLFNEGFFAGYLKDSEVEKYRRLTGSLSKFLDGAERHYCDSCAGLELDGKVEHAIYCEIKELRSALDALKEEK